VLVNTGIKRIFFEKPYKLHTLEDLRRTSNVTLEQVQVEADAC
jgi:deoxycytidylate deaminase